MPWNGKDQACETSTSLGCNNPTPGISTPLSLHSVQDHRIVCIYLLQPIDYLTIMSPTSSDLDITPSIVG